MFHVSCYKSTKLHFIRSHTTKCSSVISVIYKAVWTNNVLRVLHFLMVTGRLFHKVAVAFLKHLLPYVTPRVVGMAKNAPDSDQRCLVG